MQSELKTSFSFKRYLLAIILLIVFLGITIALYLIVKENRRNFNQAIFENRSQLAKEAINQRLQNYYIILRSTRALYSSSDSVTESEWKTFINSLQIENHYPGAKGVGYSCIIDEKDTSSIVTQARKTLHEEYSIWPATSNKLKAPVIYWYPETPDSKKVLGFDIFSEPKRKLAIEQAIKNNSPSISNKVTLITESDTSKQPGFIIYMPLYKKSVSIASEEDRKKQVKGIIYSPFRTYDFINSILKENFPELEIEIYDNTIAPQNLIFDSNKANSLTHQKFNFRIMHVIYFNGNKWKIIFESKEKFLSPTEREFPIIILLTGTLISILIFLITWAVLHNKLKSDISQQIIRDKNQQLKKINNDLDNFVYTASHDLKSPINNLEGLMKIMKEESTNSENRSLPQVITMMDESIIKLKNTIIELTDIGRIQKETEEKYEVINLKELIDEVLFNYKNTIDKIGASITFELSEEEIKFSKKNLRSIIDNLLSNALKYYSPERKPQILLSSYKKDKLIHLCIRDNGMGIPKAQLGNIFGMFKRAHSHVPGSGVGLYLIKRIMDNSGGQISVESEVNKGSSFTLIFKNVS